jgi:hypothetical protein
MFVALDLPPFIREAPASDLSENGKVRIEDLISRWHYTCHFRTIGLHHEISEIGYDMLSLGKYL